MNTIIGCERISYLMLSDGYGISSKEYKIPPYKIK